MFEGIKVKVKGASHIKNGTDCQDYADKYIHNDDYAIAVVADGHGSKKHFRSDKGAKFAVESAIETINEYMQNKEKFLESYKNNQDYLLDRIKKTIITKWTIKVEEDIEKNNIQEDEKEKFWDGKYEEDKKTSVYGTTLLVGVISEQCNFGFVIGDGCFVIIDDGGQVSIPIDDKNSRANYTTSISSSNAIENFQHIVFDKKPFAIILSTDGLIKTFNSEEDFLEYNQLIIMEICKINKEEIEKFEEKLSGIFIHRSEQGSEDDISLSTVYCIKEKENMLKILEYEQQINKLKNEMKNSEKLSDEVLKIKERVEQLERNLEELKNSKSFDEEKEDLINEGE